MEMDNMSGGRLKKWRIHNSALQHEIWKEREDQMSRTRVEIHHVSRPERENSLLTSR